MIARTRFVSAMLSGGLVVATLALAGCGSDEDSSTDTAAAQTTAAAAQTTAGAAGTAAAGSGAVLTISDFRFSPLTVTAGEVITITNEDGGVPHTVTADDGSFSVDVDATAELTIPAAGSYAIHCEIHTSMTGTIIVS